MKNTKGFFRAFRVFRCFYHFAIGVNRIAEGPEPQRSHRPMGGNGQIPTLYSLKNIKIVMILCFVPIFF